MRPTLVVIVGPTASGKSDLAMKTAREFNGEIIAADSRTVYKGMDIGTAKPSKKDQEEVRHWGLDLVDPRERFTAYQYKKYAGRAINDILSRNKLPILVGGTGLYINSVLYNYNFPKLKTSDPLNPRHRPKGAYAKDMRLAPGVLILGLLPADNDLKKKIENRAENIFKNGIVNETKSLIKEFGDLGGSAGIAYKLALEVLAGDLSEPEAIERVKTRDWQYARRQKTWFKRDKNIHWFSDIDQACKYISRVLNK